MKKLLIIFLLIGFTYNMWGQYMPHVPTGGISIQQTTTPDTLGFFDPLRTYIHHLQIDKVINELTQSGRVDEFRRKQTLNYLKYEIDFWKERKDKLFKSPDMLLTLSAIGIAAIGFACLQRQIVNYSLKDNPDFLTYGKDGVTPLKCNGPCKRKEWYYNKYCQRCEDLAWAELYIMSEKEKKLGPYFIISLPILGYLLYRYSKTCPIANYRLKRLQNIEYFVRLLSN